jgi:hypothetical protein
MACTLHVVKSTLTYTIAEQVCAGAVVVDSHVLVVAYSRLHLSLQADRG